MKLFVVILLLSVSVSNAQAVLKGKVVAEGKPLPLVNIHLEEARMGAVTDLQGAYIFENIPLGTHVLQVSSIGYETVFKKVHIYPGHPMSFDIELNPIQNNLDEILLVDTFSGLTRRTPYNISTIPMEEIASLGNPGGMMGVLREVPGIYGAEFGQGIVKPFIRGQGFTRIVSIYQGNKLENHQWGADHGLGINDIGIKSVEIIKGPASVLYGSGALGGVLLAKDQDSYLRSNKLSGNLGTTYNSISQGIRITSSWNQLYHSGLFFATDLAYENHADYKDGEDRLIGNSRYNTQTVRMHGGLHRRKFQNKLSLTYNHQNLGIISDDEMLQSHATSRVDRVMQLPFQEVKDILISYNQLTNSDAVETSLHISHHLNTRREIETSRELLDLGLRQHHSFFNARVSLPQGNFRHNLGIQGSFLKNSNIPGAREILIPDARFYENGLYYMGGLELHSWYLQGAIRYDYRIISADASSNQLIEKEFILPGSPSSRKLTRDFSGFSGSVGITKTLGKKHTLKFNFSTGFRSPDLAELFSNGPHPGTNRFEKGNENFGREQSFQCDINYTYTTGKFSANFSLFGNLVDNYIFFAATGEDLSQPAYDLWEYQQTSALFRGMEVEIKHTWMNENRLETSVNAAVVRARDKYSHTSIGFIPPDHMNLHLRYYLLPNKSLNLHSRLRLINNQKRTGLNEEPTAGYFLINVGISKNFDMRKNHLEAALTLENAFNRHYVDHMSILRAFEIASPGRNLMMNLKYHL